MIKQSTNNVSVICLFWGVFKKRKENNIIVGFLLSGISDYFLSVFLQELYSLLENIAKATIEVFQKSAEMNSSNPSGNGAAAQGGSASNNNSTTSKMKPILRCVSPRVLLKFVCFFVVSGHLFIRKKSQPLHLGLNTAMLTCNISYLQLIRAIGCLAGGSVDSQAAHVSPGPCAKGSRRRAGERAAPWLFFT